MDEDDPHTSNAIIRYKITAQLPRTSEGDVFDINPVSGMIGVRASGLDREVTYDLFENTSVPSPSSVLMLCVCQTQPEYKLVIEAADMEGEGLTSTCTAVITVIDANDNAPLFSATFVS